MRILKRKIQAKQAKCKIAAIPPKVQPVVTSKNPRKSNKETLKNQIGKSSQPKKRNRIKDRTTTPKIYLQAKNIVTNFGKAMAAFAISPLCTPYLISILQQLNQEGNNISQSQFMQFMSGAKSAISSIDSLRALILEDMKDTELDSLCKKVFRMIGEVFIKYFSVNWIIHGRVTYKMEHLKFRYKMLRRIQNPEMFTYLKGYDSTVKKEEENQQEIQ